MTAADREGFAKRLSELLDRDYRKNRAALAREIHVSPSALSQYARGRASPSLEVLVGLAKALNVSLDYLVLGEESLPYPADYSYWVGHMEGMFRRLTAQSASLRDFVGRIGADLAQQIEASARNHLADSTAIGGGALTAAEVAGVESFSLHTRIATVDLDLDVLLPRAESDNVTAVPGPFVQTIVDNIAQGRGYEYLIPEGAEWARKARFLRDLISEELSNRKTGSEALVDRNVKFYQSAHALVPSFVLYLIQGNSLAHRVPRLYDQISDFIAVENSAASNSDADTGLVAVVEPMSHHLQSYQLIAQENISRLLQEYHRMQKESRLLPTPRGRGSSTIGRQ